MHCERILINFTKLKTPAQEWITLR